MAAKPCRQTWQARSACGTGRPWRRRLALAAACQLGRRPPAGRARPAASCRYVQPPAVGVHRRECCRDTTDADGDSDVLALGPMSCCARQPLNPASVGTGVASHYVSGNCGRGSSKSRPSTRYKADVLPLHYARTRIAVTPIIRRCGPAPARRRLKLAGVHHARHYTAPLTPRAG